MEGVPATGGMGAALFIVVVRDITTCPIAACTVADAWAIRTVSTGAGTVVVTVGVVATSRPVRTIIGGASTNGIGGTATKGVI